MMNWRIKVTSVVLLGLFALACFLYVRFYVAPKAHGIVLFIAPGTDLNLLQGLDNSVLLTTQPDASLITDKLIHPAQHYSHLSTGIAGVAGAIGMNDSGEPLNNLFYQAQRSNRRIGIVSTTTFTHPASAAFFSHAPAGTDASDIAPQLFDSTTINVMLGSNPKYLTLLPQRNLAHEARERGYEVIRSPKEIDNIPRWRTRLLLGVFDYPDDLFDPEGHATSPSLEAMVILAIQCLQFHIGGHFMIVVHPSPDEITYAGELPAEFRRAHAYQLNAALQSAYDYTGENDTVLLYAPQPDASGWLIQLKGKSTPDDILSLGNLHETIQKLF